MKQLIQLTFQAIKKSFLLKEYKYCFELFGYDFIIDDLLNVWLIEVNTNPCLEESSDLLKQLMPRMINDAFKLTIDQVPITYNHSVDLQKNKSLREVPRGRIRRRKKHVGTLAQH